MEDEYGNRVKGLGQSWHGFSIATKENQIARSAFKTVIGLLSRISHRLVMISRKSPDAEKCLF
jgi:hypothetical protein